MQKQIVNIFTNPEDSPYWTCISTFLVFLRALLSFAFLDRILEISQLVTKSNPSSYTLGRPYFVNWNCCHRINQIPSNLFIVSRKNLKQTNPARRKSFCNIMCVCRRSSSDSQVCRPLALVSPHLSIVGGLNRCPRLPFAYIVRANNCADRSNSLYPRSPVCAFRWRLSEKTSGKNPANKNGECKTRHQSRFNKLFLHTSPHSSPEEIVA